MMRIGEYRIHGFPITMRIPEPPGIPAIAPFHRGILEVSSNIPVIATVIDKPASLVAMPRAGREAV